MKASLSFIVCIWSALLLAHTALYGQPPAEPPPLDTTRLEQAPRNPGTPVVFEGDTLFRVYTRIGPFTQEDRAAAIADRLRRLSTDPTLTIDSLRQVESDDATEIMMGPVVIMEVTQADADSAGIERSRLARDYIGELRTVLQNELEETSLQSILLGALFTLLATLVLVVAMKVMSRFFPRIYTRLDSWRGTRMPSFRFQNLELISSDKLTDILISIVRGIRVILVLLLLYLYLPLVLGFFPWTKDLAADLFSYVTTPLSSVISAIAAYLPNLFFIIVVIVVTYYISRFVRFFFSAIEKGSISLPNFYPEWAEPTFKIVRVLIIALAGVVVFPRLPGAGTDAFQSISIFFGVLFSLGSANAIANMMSGLVLTYTRAFKLGDRVKIADAVGDVVEKTLLVTRIRTIKNVDITIPNAMVLTSHIINFSSSAEDHQLILNPTVTIGYDVPWRQIHELLISAAQATENIEKDPAPFVLQTALNDFYVSYELNAYTNHPHIMARTYSELHKNIQDAFNNAGVEIMSPHYSAIRDGNQATVPEGNLPKDYTAPGFRIFPFGNIFPGVGRPSRSDGPTGPDQGKS